MRTLQTFALPASCAATRIAVPLSSLVITRSYQGRRVVPRLGFHRSCLAVAVAVVSTLPTLAIGSASNRHPTITRHVGPSAHGWQDDALDGAP